MAKYPDRDEEGQEEFLPSPGETSAEEDPSCGQIDVPMDRRGFLAKAGAAGLALVHFTLLGSSRAEAQCPPSKCSLEPVNDFCTCDSDKGVWDVCPPGAIDPAADYCKCSNDPGDADVCPAVPSLEDDSGADYCTDEGAGQAVDACRCYWDSGPNQADLCNCGTDRTNNIDYCACTTLADPPSSQNPGDLCDCPRDPGSYVGHPGQQPNMADWCAKDSDSTPEPPTSNDVCDCGEEGDQNGQGPDACWGDYDPSPPERDCCTCGKDRGYDGSVGADACICLYDGNVYDKCDVGLPNQHDQYATPNEDVCTVKRDDTNDVCLVASEDNFGQGDECAVQWAAHDWCCPQNDAQGTDTDGDWEPDVPPSP